MEVKLSENAKDIYQRATTGMEPDVFPSDGTEWVSVQLDTLRPPEMNAHAFAGYLSALEAVGLYRTEYENTAFGLFKIQAKAPTKQ